MTGNFKRTKASEDVVGSKSLDLAYNDRAGGFKMLGPILGQLSPLGALSAAKGADAGSLIAVFNDSLTTSYVATAPTSAIAAPTSAANGIPVPPNAYVIIAMGSDNYIRSSTATTFGYKILDESSYSPST